MRSEPSDTPIDDTSTDPCAALVAVAREATEVAAGFAVLGFQRLQVRRREVERSFDIPPGTPLFDSVRRIADTVFTR